VSNRRLCTSAEAAVTARGSAHPTLKQGRDFRAKQQRSPIPGRQPQQVASLHPRTAKVTCPVYKQITSRSSCLFEHCLEPRDGSKTGLCISQRPFHSLHLRKIRLLLHSPCLPLSRCGYHFSAQFDCPNRSSMIRREVTECLFFERYCPYPSPKRVESPRPSVY
jgi:hypothetical protein